MPTTYPWVTQIGPDISGSCDGYLNSNSGNFYVELGQGPDVSYASYSTTGGSQWVPIPNNQQVSVTGSNSIAWRINAPAGVSFKFLMWPAK